jgi:hypothetical protein
MKRLFLLAFALVGTMAQAEDSVDATVATQLPVAAPAPAPKLKASLTSYYYDFEGTQGQKKNLYSFKDLNLAMQIATVSYDVSPKLTLLVMGTRLENYAETKLGPIFGGGLYKDRTSGSGDTLVSAMTTYVPSATFILVADAGVSIPTGSIKEKNKNDPTGKANYPYNMQLGSGTYDTVIGVTPLYFSAHYHLGGRLAATLRNGYNSEEYRLGHQYKADAWIDYPTSLGITPRLVGYYKEKDSIAGEDKSLGRNVLTEFYYHDQINWEVAAAVKYTKAFGAVALNAEVGLPVVQNSVNVDDVVVETQYYGSLGITGTF